MTKPNLIKVNRLRLNWSSLTELLPQGNGWCLDLGAGDGRHRTVIEQAGWRWIGIDIAESSALRIAGDARYLPLVSESIHLVFANQVLEHVSSPGTALAEVYRVLRPNAWLIGSVSFLEPFHNSYYGFSHWGVEELLTEQGFNLVEMRPGTSVFVTLVHALLPDIGIGPTFGRFFGMLIMFLLRWFGRAYILLRFGKNSNQWKQLDAFFYKAPLRFAGHIMFAAQKAGS